MLQSECSRNSINQKTESTVALIGYIYMHQQKTALLLLPTLALAAKVSKTIAFKNNYHCFTSEGKYYDSSQLTHSESHTAYSSHRIPGCS